MKLLTLLHQCHWVMGASRPLPSALTPVIAIYAQSLWSSLREAATLNFKEMYVVSLQQTPLHGTRSGHQIQGTLVTRGLNAARRRIQTLQAQDRIPCPKGHRPPTRGAFWFVSVAELHSLSPSILKRNYISYKKVSFFSILKWIFEILSSNVIFQTKSPSVVISGDT